MVRMMLQPQWCARDLMALLARQENLRLYIASVASAILSTN